MLKHFAIATCALTACLALFADGEGQNEFGHSVAAQQHEVARAAAAAGEKVKPKFSMNTKIRDARRTYVPFPTEGDDGGSYGAPMDSSSGGGGGGSSGPSFRAGPPSPAIQPANESARGGPPEPGKFLPGQGGAQPKRGGARQPRKPTPEEAERLQAISLQRSGTS